MILSKSIELIQFNYNTESKDVSIKELYPNAIETGSGMMEKDRFIEGMEEFIETIKKIEDES